MVLQDHRCREKRGFLAWLITRRSSVRFTHESIRLAEAHVQIVAEVIEGDVATKHDLSQTREGLEYKILQMEYRLTIKMGAMFTLAVGIIISAMNLLTRAT